MQSKSLSKLDVESSVGHAEVMYPFGHSLVNCLDFGSVISVKVELEVGGHDSTVGGRGQRRSSEV